MTAGDRFDRMGREELLAWAENPIIDTDVLARQPEDHAQLKARVRGLAEVAIRKAQEDGVGSDGELRFLRAARRLAETGVLCAIVK